jgi:hypothetical protein
LADSTLNAVLTLRTAGEGSERAADLCVGAARTMHALLSLWAGRITYWFAALALPLHALLLLLTAVEAFATVILVSVKVYAPVVAAPLAFGAAANLVVSPPDAVPRAALRVPTTLPSQAPAIVIGQGNPWY